MSTSLHGIFIVDFGNVYFVIVISNICGQKTRFSENNQNSMFEKSIFVLFEVIFLNLKIFPRAGVAISC